MTYTEGTGSCSKMERLHQQTRQCLMSMSHLKGAQMVLGIMPPHHNVNTKTGSCDDYSDETLSPGYAGGMIHEEPIPMTDHRALAEYKARSKQLICEIEADLQLGFIKEAEEKQAEFDKIQMHILEVTKPDGRIKNFPTGMMKTYQRVYQEYRYLLKKLKVENPEVYHYLKVHISTGSTFKWIIDS